MKNGLSWLDYLHALKEEIKEMFLPASHKITKMGKGVTKRTRKFRDSFSIRMQLNEKEDELEKYYLELGHRFYADRRRKRIRKKKAVPAREYPGKIQGKVSSV